MTARTFQRLPAGGEMRCSIASLMAPDLEDVLLIMQQHIDSYQADGAVLIKGLFADL